MQQVFCFKGGETKTAMQIALEKVGITPKSRKEKDKEKDIGDYEILKCPNCGAQTKPRAIEYNEKGNISLNNKKKKNRKPDNEPAETNTDEKKGDNE